jgi:hypothetical protein
MTAADCTKLMESPDFPVVGAPARRPQSLFRILLIDGSKVNCTIMEVNLAGGTAAVIHPLATPAIPALPCVENGSCSSVPPSADLLN